MGAAPAPREARWHLDRGRLIAIVGGPGAGKTAVLEVARRRFEGSTVIVPGAASVLFKGGFPRRSSETARRCAQRAIFHVTRLLEDLTLETAPEPFALCDRGTLDGLAWWPGPSDDFFEQLGTSFEAEARRYRAVIHLRTPGGEGDYPSRDPLQIESAREAAAIDERLLEVWSAHPRRHVIPAMPDFADKVMAALEVLAGEIAAAS
jgi:hypothetical protein